MSWIASVQNQLVGQANVNGTKLQALTLPLPPHSEQEAIGKKIKRRFFVLDEVEAEVEANAKRASRLRQARLKRVFEGKLVPQDPADEPASELLAQIRVERERSSLANRRKKTPARHEPAGAQTGLF